MMSQTRASFLRCTNSSYNSTTKNKHPNQEKGRGPKWRNGDISPKNKCRWPIGTYKDAQHHYQGNVSQNYNEVHHLTLVRMVITTKSTETKYWRRCGEKGTLLHCWWECKLVQSLWKTMWRCLRKLKIELHHMIQQSYFWVYIRNR